MNSYVFASFVGLQVESVINAIDSCFCAENKKYPVDRIVLYATLDDTSPDGKVSSGTRVMALNVEKHCQKCGYPPVEIIMYRRTENHCEEFINKEVSCGRQILFFIEGGMNFSVAQYMSSLCSLSRNSALLISDGNIFRTVSIDDSFNKLDFDDEVLTFNEKSAKEILEDQCVPYKILDTDTPLASFIKASIRERKFPKDALFNVEIDGLPFDMVWNCGGNHLALLGATANKGKGISSYLKGVRAYASFAAGKTGSKAFYDSMIYIQCIKKSLKEQVSHESRGKAIALNTVGYVKDGYFYSDVNSENRSLRSVQLEKELDRIFAKKYRPSQLDEILRKEVIINSDSFITTMGKDASATIKAIGSHFKHSNFSNAILLSTKDLVEKCQKLILKLKSLPELKNVSFRIVTTDIKGRSIAYRLKLGAGASNIAINITPGTKGQTAFLTLFATVNNCKVYALVDSKVIPVTKNAEDAFEVSAFDPLPILSSDPNSVKAIAYKTVPNVKKASYKSLHNCIKDDFKLDENCQPFEKELEKSGYKLYKSEADGVRIKNDTLGVDQKLGDWFEEFSAAGFAAIRDAVVYENVKYYRSDKVGHITEIDNLVSTGHMIIAVSCKAFWESIQEHQISNYRKAINEVISFARSVNRLCIPVLCCIDKYHLQDVELVGEAKVPVGVISLKELCDPKKIKQILDKVDEMTRYDHTLQEDEILDVAPNLE